MLPAGVRAALMILLVSLLLIPGGRTTAPPSSSLHDLLATQRSGPAYSPDRIRAAYKFAPLHRRNIDGSGVTVALIELDQYAAADVHMFDGAYGMGDPRVTEYFAGGASFQPQQL